MCLTLNLSMWMSCSSSDTQWKCNNRASNEGQAQSAAVHKTHPGEQRSCVLRKDGLQEDRSAQTLLSSAKNRILKHSQDCPPCLQPRFGGV